MKRVTVRVPLRVDLAGGTLDLWPLYLFHPGARTVNVAISMFAEVEVSTRNDAAIEVSLTDVQHHRTYDTLTEMREDPQVALIATIIDHFRLTGVSVVTRTEAPRGSGLGGSSALAVATTRALAEIASVSIEPDELIALVRDLESRLLGVPAGIQDYYPPIFGGLTTLHLEPGQVARHPMTLNLGELARHMIVFYTGIAHFSGTNNWEIYKQHLDGDEDVVSGLGTIARAAAQMEKALEAGEFPAAGAALAEEWQARRELVSGVANPEIDKAIMLAVSAGAWAGKVCGAGGGGCVLFLSPPERRRAVLEALSRLPGHVLDVAPVGVGMTVDSPEQTQKSFSFGSRRRRGLGDELEHLYRVSSSHGSRKPFMLVESIITWDDPRREIHHREERTYLAPIDLHRESVDWSSALSVDLDDLGLTADPPSSAELSISPKDEALVAAIGAAEEQAKEHLVQTERLTVYENQAFGLYSEPGENPAAFLVRCADTATEMIEERASTLESTFRRRINQIRERSERDQRESDERDTEAGLSTEGSDVTRGSGQDLYNITTGKGTGGRSAESPAEADYLEKIALVQKAWEKELEDLRIELSTKAESIEEVALAPTLRNVEIARIVVVWQ